jgi:hypothetical protein
VSVEVRNVAGEVGLCVLPSLYPHFCYEHGCIVSLLCGVPQLQPFPLQARPVRCSSLRDQTALCSSTTGFLDPFLSRRPWGLFP